MKTKYKAPVWGFFISPKIILTAIQHPSHSMCIFNYGKIKKVFETAALDASHCRHHCIQLSILGHV